MIAHLGLLHFRARHPASHLYRNLRHALMAVDVRSQIPPVRIRVQNQALEHEQIAHVHRLRNAIRSSKRNDVGKGRKGISPNRVASANRTHLANSPLSTKNKECVRYAQLPVRGKTPIYEKAFTRCVRSLPGYEVRWLRRDWVWTSVSWCNPAPVLWR